MRRGQQPFIYDPSVQIDENLAKGNEGLEKGFRTLIAKRQQDFNVVKDQYDRIESIKENLNSFNQEKISADANALLEKTASEIKEKGQLDYKSIGAIQSQINKLAKVKQKSDISVELYEKYMGQLKENAHNIYDIGAVNQKFQELMSSDSLYSPNNIQKEFEDVYNNSIDIMKVSKERFDVATPIKSLNINKPNVGLVQVDVRLPKGFKLNPDGSVSAEVSEGNNPLETLMYEMLNPQEIQVLTKQLREKNGAGAFLSERDVALFFGNNILSQIESTVSEKKVVQTVEQGEQRMGSAASSQARAELTQKQIENFDEKFKLEKQKVNAGSIRASVSAQRLSLDLQKQGFTERQAELELKDNGYVKKENGEYEYVKEKDTRLSRISKPKEDKLSSIDKLTDAVNKGSNTESNYTKMKNTEGL